MGTHRIEALLDRIDAQDMAGVDRTTVSALVKATRGIVRNRLASIADHGLVADAAQTASAVAVAIYGRATLDGSPMDVGSAAALASYRACNAAMEDAGTGREDAADILSATDVIDERTNATITLPRTVDPASMATTTDSDRLADALASLARTHPGYAQALTFATYLEAEGYGSAGNGTAGPIAATKLAALLGLTERRRKALGKALPGMLALLSAHAKGTMHAHATQRGQIHYGASESVRTVADALAVSVPASSGHGQYGMHAQQAIRSGRASWIVRDIGGAITLASPDGAHVSAPLEPDSATTRASVEFVLTHPASVTYARTADDKASDAWVARQEPAGAVRKSSSVKRKRDGAIGSPTTSGHAPSLV